MTELLAPPSTARLALLQGKFALLEAYRSPIAILGSFVFPSLMLSFFVFPQRTIASDMTAATAAIASTSVLAVMSNALFQLGLGVARDRESAWYEYMRTLPGAQVARVFGYIIPLLVTSLISIIPLLILGKIFTAAEASPGRILLGVAALLVGLIPLSLIGLLTGLLFSSKSALAIVQIEFFSLAFLGGMFIPPQLFLPTLEFITRFSPSREVRELVLWAVQGGAIDPWVWGGIIAWTVILGSLALRRYRTQERRRFR